MPACSAAILVQRDTRWISDFFERTVAFVDVELLWRRVVYYD